ncbi:MAG TPA: hypothetical protein VFF73_22945 [Planctomycetota bacterium]|nr:hypothetical protein [Planctomycetota bacterium]
MLRPFLALVLLVALAGCKSQPASTANDERPRVGDDARWWEVQSHGELARAWRADNLAVREQQFEFAIRDLVRARSLYYDELESLENAPSTDMQVLGPYPGIRYAAQGPIPAGRREALEIEIRRLTREIAELVRERPIEDPEPVRLSDQLTPRNTR